MAFKASNVLPAVEYENAKRVAVQLKSQAQYRSTAFASGATSAEILSMVDQLRTLRAKLDAAKAVPGIAAYAQAQENDGTYDVATEFTAMIAAIDAVITEVVTTFPKDVNGWMLINSINADGTLAPRAFTGAQLANIRSLLDSLAAAID